MSNERRLVLFVMVTFAWVMGSPYLLTKLGLVPPPPKKAVAVKADAAKGQDARGEDAEKKGEPTVPKPDQAPTEPPTIKADAAPSQIELVPASELVLGSIADKSPTGYRFAVQLDQKGAGVDSAVSSRYEADFEGRVNPHLPLQLIGRDRSKPQFSSAWPPSLALTLSPGDAVGRAVPLRPDERVQLAGLDPEAATEDLLDAQVWEVVRDEQGRVVRPLKSEAKDGAPAVEGQEAVFRTKADNGVIVTKTFRLWQNADGFEFDLKFESPDQDRSFAYNLLGPYGIPIEGEWYTATFREIFFGTAGRGGTVALTAHTAYEIAKATDKTFDSTVDPLRFAGVENQYFAILVAPMPAPTSNEDRIDRATTAVVLHRHPQDIQKSDVGVRISSKPIKVGPNTPQSFSFKVFAGPKTEAALIPYGAEELAVYRKGIIPLAPTIARYFITPILSFTYALTEQVAAFFGGTRGNFGIAIILLTLVVKMLLFPLGRKQALMAQRMQALQPHMKEIQEKYKDDKERLTRETFALYKKHGANPVSGCLPALVQLPIFVGLWQALNTSVGLRQSSFLWINDLAAPDMLFRFPFDVIFLGHWFNLLPILVVGLMMIQTKLFSPPPTTPEAEMQQKTMKYMMVVMAVMFYKVPSGLGLYFITSSLWSIGERLLLPKIIHEKPVAEEEETGRNGNGRKGPAAPAAPPKPEGGLAKFWNRVLDEARKDPTYRKIVDERDGKDAKGKDRPASNPDRPDDRRDRGKPRARPGRK
ncbi:membrane protein insertase YidC [Planctomyces sp. SH-PL62]|uniref:membrane protein insertase YidC n=1 Tax=Planctomyces sp. SH-PL62 TaxID=1636152 RepID=UPI00078D3331|nr:membrane protein insertase YidC [Planctomyces sp. SH-PL62]AMV36584.1 Membrane protein insertase YidC [Planctomyces sp. SH-PL62]